jgi:THO complex subunit 5
MSGGAFAEALSEFQTVCAKVRDACAQMVALKQRDPKLRNTSKELAGLENRCRMLFLELKQLNRDLNVQEQDTKLEVRAQKSEQDNMNLEMQGLQYEKSHFLKEIKKATDFTPAFGATGLVGLEDFQADVTDAAGLEKHALHLRRLVHELDARQQLLEKVKELTEEKARVTKASEVKRALLVSLNGKMSSLYAEATAIQRELPEGAPLLPASPLCSQLPRPLYNIYNVALCYKSHFDNTLDTSILESESDDVDMKSATSSPSAEPAATASPLHVIVSLSAADKSIALTFKYIAAYGVVAVSCAGTGATKELLTNLFPMDDGNHIPGTWNDSLASTRELDKDLGQPFLWAQTLCGLHFGNPAHPAHAKVDLVTVLRRLRYRVLVDVGLTRQISFLAKKSTASLGPSLEAAVPSKHNAVVTKWTKVPHASFFNSTKENADEWWRLGASYYQLTVGRGTSGSLDALVEITPEYPLRPPLFHVFLDLKQDGSNGKALVPNTLVKSTADEATLALAQANSHQGGEKYNMLKDIMTELNTQFPMDLRDLALLEEKGEACLLSFQVR